MDWIKTIVIGLWCIIILGMVGTPVYLSYSEHGPIKFETKTAVGKIHVDTALPMWLIYAEIKSGEKIYFSQAQTTAMIKRGIKESDDVVVNYTVRTEYERSGRVHNRHIEVAHWMPE